jgi:hypothetical protein
LSHDNTPPLKAELHGLVGCLKVETHSLYLSLPSGFKKG